jgi:hypothetical protein
MLETPSRRPMTYTFLELLDRTFRLYRDNFITIIGVVAIITIPITALTLLLNPATSSLLTNQPFRSTNNGTSLLGSILSLIQSVVVNGTLIYIASEYIFNHKLSIGEAFSGASSRYTKMGCGIIVFGIFIIIVGVLAVILVIAIPPALALFGILFFIIISAYSVFFQVLALENVGPSAAVTRAYMLGKRRFWTVIGLTFVVGLISVIIGAILGGSVTFLVLSTTPGRNTSTQFLLISFLTTIISIFVTPISPIAFTLLYYDIRTRTEGLDIMLDSSGNPAARPGDFPPPDSGFKIEGSDWRNIAILTVCGLLIGIAGSAFIKTFVDQYTRSLR